MKKALKRGSKRHLLSNVKRGALNSWWGGVGKCFMQDEENSESGEEWDDIEIYRLYRPFDLARTRMPPFQLTTRGLWLAKP